MLMWPPARRSASIGGRRLLIASAIVPVLVMVGGAANAVDQNEASLSDPLTATLLGPVGVAALAVGIAGLLLGLLRMRRRTRHSATRNGRSPAGSRRPRAEAG